MNSIFMSIFFIIVIVFLCIFLYTIYIIRHDIIVNTKIKKKFILLTIFAILVSLYPSYQFSNFFVEQKRIETLDEKINTLLEEKDYVTANDEINKFYNSEVGKIKPNIQDKYDFILSNNYYELYFVQKNIDYLDKAEAYCNKTLSRGTISAANKSKLLMAKILYQKSYFEKPLYNLEKALSYIDENSMKDDYVFIGSVYLRMYKITGNNINIEKSINFFNFSETSIFDNSKSKHVEKYEIAEAYSLYSETKNPIENLKKSESILINIKKEYATDSKSEKILKVDSLLADVYIKESKHYDKKFNLDKAIMILENNLANINLENYPYYYAIYSMELGNCLVEKFHYYPNDTELEKADLAYANAMKIININTYPAQYAELKQSQGQLLGYKYGFEYNKELVDEIIESYNSTLKMVKLSQYQLNVLKLSEANTLINMTRRSFEYKRITKDYLNTAITMASSVVKDSEDDLVKAKALTTRGDAYYALLLQTSKNKNASILDRVFPSKLISNSLSDYKEALKLAEMVHNNEMAASLKYNIGKLLEKYWKLDLKDLKYMDVHEELKTEIIAYQSALKYHKEALDYYSKMSSQYNYASTSIGLAIINSNLANRKISEHKKYLSEADLYLNNALKILNKEESLSLAYCKEQIGFRKNNEYLITKNPDLINDSINYHIESLEIFVEYRRASEIASSSCIIGQRYKELYKLTKDNDYKEQAIKFLEGAKLIYSKYPNSGKYNNVLDEIRSL